jgi:hypothetical protein
MPFFVNGEEVQLAHSEHELTRVNTSFDIAGETTAEYRLTERDQTSPAGRFRFRATGDKLVIQRATSPTSDPWATYVDLLTLSDEGITPDVDLDVDGISHFVANIVTFITPKEAVAAVEWLQGHGPTVDPDGYAVVAVGDSKLGILPFWNYGR